jgi:hypothetical protein
MGRSIEGTLRKVLAGTPSAEVRNRIERILDTFAPETEKGKTSGQDRLRILRALEVLEMIGSPEARKLVETMTKGSAESEITIDAKATLERMTAPR